MDYILFILAFLASVVSTFLASAQGKWSTILSIVSILIAGAILIFAAKDHRHAIEVAENREREVAAIRSSMENNEVELEIANERLATAAIERAQASQQLEKLREENAQLQLSAEASQRELQDMRAPSIIASINSCHYIGCKVYLRFKNVGGRISMINEFRIEPIGFLLTEDRQYSDIGSCPFNDSYFPYKPQTFENIRLFDARFAIDVEPYSLLYNSGEIANIENGEIIASINLTYFEERTEALKFAISEEYAIQRKSQGLPPLDDLLIRHCIQLHYGISIFVKYQNSTGSNDFTDHFYFIPELSGGYYRYLKRKIKNGQFELYGESRSIDELIKRAYAPFDYELDVALSNYLATQHKSKH